ncbi:tyrosine-type recombinase/integrase [Melaminivora alkalimesophila]|uniref:Integrase n=1 Tax=Melaminivora alkalimesophila TaxID=1165852 RepID=A0A317RHV2_9BURK|nr:integrase arm-type DNA-binding domain-containing protein [Melaminivora alkalimesophila]PWW47732.1 integrase [Melaminivora alkalimesophila]
MARAINRLSALQVKTAKVPGYYADGGNLWLQVARGGSKSWVLRYTLAGKSREMGLGSASTFSLQDARDRAQAARKLLADGIDPIDAKREAQQQARMEASNRRTFTSCAAEYIKAHEAGWKSAKHAAQWTATLETYAHPIIGGMAVADVETAHVLRVLEPIWRTKAETASRLRGRIENILDWATVQKYRSGDNPARWRGHLDKLLPARSKVQKVQHHPALPWREMGAFMRELRGQQGTAARAVELIILSACRTSEAFNADWREIDLAQRTWTIPAARMKAGKEHVIPLSDAAVSVLQAQAAAHGMEGFIFPGTRPGKPLSNMAGLMLLKRMGRADLTVHGFRSSFRDWAGESTSHPREVIEHALAHGLKDKVEAAYARGTLFEKRNALMSDWARHCDHVPLPADVVPIRNIA